MRQDQAELRPRVGLDAAVFSFCLGSYIIRANCSASGMDTASKVVMVGASGWGGGTHC